MSDPRVEYLTHVAMEGTLGDFFIVLCKCAHLHKISGQKISLDVWCDQPIMFEPIKQLAALVPWLGLMIREGPIPQKSGNFLNVSADGKGAGHPDDPEEVKMEPYPRLFGAPFKNTNIEAVQLFAGRWIGSNVGNFRAFSVEDVDRLAEIITRRHNIPIGFAVETPLIYLPEYAAVLEKHGGQLRLLSCVAEGIRLMREAQILYSPIGFYTFMILSMGKPAKTFYTSDTNLVRIHPKWRDHLKTYKEPVDPEGNFKDIELEELT